jgi:hypothetical protein
MENVRHNRAEANCNTAGSSDLAQSGTTPGPMRVVDLTDPMKCAETRGWLRGELRAPPT